MAFIETRGRVYIREKFNFDYTNMAAISLFWNTKMATAVTLREKARGPFTALEF